MPQPALEAFDVRRMVLSRNAVECFPKIAMTALPSGRVTMCLLPDHDALRLIILSAACDAINRKFGTVVHVNNNSIAAVPTDRMLSAANDRMAERAADRVSFDDTPLNQQEYRAAVRRGGGSPRR